MRVRFAFDPAAWDIASARRAVETLASLLETPHRLTPSAAPAGEDEALVYVGAPGSAPADAAAVISVEGWPKWEGRSLERIAVAGEPLPCPPGTRESSEGVTSFPAEWLRAVAFALAREEEAQESRRDQWECYSGFYTRLGEIGLLERPFVNHAAAALDRRLEAHAAGRGRSLERIPRWKGGARFAVALTHDVDDVSLRSFRMAWRLLRQARSPGSYAFRAGLTGLVRAIARPPRAPDPYWSFERWMSEEERCGFRSTFYVFAPSPSARHEYDAHYVLDDRLQYEGRWITVRQLLHEIRRRGHEVGLHGSYLSHTSAEELARQRDQVAGDSGGEVLGIRQHFLRFDVGATWMAQAAAGFGYDTTLGYNEALGFRAGIAAPFRPWDASTGAAFGLWELPLTAMDGTLFRTLKLDGAAAAEAIGRHLDAIEAAQGLAVLLWHPNAADRASFPGWWDCYMRVLDELSRRSAWVASAGEISRWWNERCGRLIAPKS